MNYPMYYSDRSNYLQPKGEDFPLVTNYDKTKVKTYRFNLILMSEE